jgi:aspartate carbamoyltransferase catalytic subunit
MTRKHLISMRDLSRDDIQQILDTAASFKDVLKRDIKKVPALRGKTVVNLFYEPSTRTRTSFEIAEKRLSTDVVNFSVSASSVTKGETLFDTIKNIEAYGVDFVVVRHSSTGVPNFIAEHMDVSVVNAGDGINEHPTQALLDAMTILEHKGEFQGLEVAIVGDIIHSRVARSDMICLQTLGARVRYVGPPTLLPLQPPAGVKLYFSLDEGLKDVDVVIMLRIQMERMNKSFFPTTADYFLHWGLTQQLLTAAKKDAIVMHPGPLNRGIEIASDVADGLQSVILQQVTNGLAVRMSVLYHLSGGEYHV